MGIWDMLSTTPKEKMRKRSITPKPLFDNDDKPAADAPINAEPLSPSINKVERELPFTPPAVGSKRKNYETSANDDGAKRLRSGTVVAAKPAVNDLNQPVIRSPRLSLSAMRPASVHRPYDIDNEGIEKAQKARTVAEMAELRARNELQEGCLQLDDWIKQKDEAEADLSATQDAIADLWRQLEALTKKEATDKERVQHRKSHVEAAEDRVEQLRQEVQVKTAAAKQAQREMATLMRGD